MKIKMIIAAMVVVMCTACERPAIDYTARGAELLQPFKANLKTALVTGLESGPVHAIGVCSREAPSIAADLSVDGVNMGRSSHRLRNPKNVTPEWLEPVLRGYADGSMKLAPLAMEIEAGRMGYAEPIIMQSMCLVCHGEELQPELAAEINASYPEDRATGFKAGDFRGVFWVEFPDP